MTRRWQNWGRTVATRPSAWYAPRTEAEVAELVRASAAAGRRVRAVGAGHSWSAIAAPEQVGITLDRCAGVVAFEPGRVTVRGGTRLRDLLGALARANHTLAIVGSIAAQSIAGLTATGTHGSSLVHGNLATLVERLRLVDGRGRIVELDGARLDGARVHLGALGVVTEVTLAIVPAFALAETIEPVPIAAVPARLEAIAASAEFCKVWWVPHTRTAHVFRYARTTERTSRPHPARQRRFDDHVMHRLVLPVAVELGRRSGLGPWLNRTFAPTLAKPRRVGPSPLMLSTPMPFRHRETEAALPMARAGEAVERVVRAVERERLVVNFPLEIRFVRGDRAWLSPASGGDTCQIGAYCAGELATPYFAAFWRELRPLGARPHWGKELDHTAAEVRALWPDAPRFLALRDELDPDRTFGGAFHARVLGA